MSNQRRAWKKLIGAQASAELWAGVDAWLLAHPGKTQSNFVLEACVEKLQREGIVIDAQEALRDRRARVVKPDPPEDGLSSEETAALTFVQIAGKATEGSSDPATAERRAPKAQRPSGAAHSSSPRSRPPTSSQKRSL
jgi:hypothetical protein